MSSKRKLRHRSCESKIRHISIAQALVHAKIVTKALHEHYSWYRCKFCKGYHVGRMTRVQKQARTARLDAMHR